MDPLSISASVFAVVQVADRIIALCKSYIKAVRDAPSDIRAFLIEISAIKSMLGNLNFIASCSNKTIALADLFASSGPIEGCRRAVSEIEALFPTNPTRSASGASSKKRRVKPTLEALAWPFKTAKATKLLDEITQYKTTISLALTTEAGRDIKEIKLKVNEIHTNLTESQRFEVYKWLRATDPSSLHHRACDQYESGTGDWMLRSDEWKSLTENNNRCVWIHGVPGAGKTILASHLIQGVKSLCEDRATTQKCAYVYYYCYFGHNQNEAAPFLKWILGQLCRQVDKIPPHLHNLYKHGGEPSLVDLLRSLEAIVEEFDSVYLVVDAVDESRERADLLKVLRDLVTDVTFQKVRVIVTSREYLDIEKVMDGISAPVSMRNPLLDEDIRLFLRRAEYSFTMP
ncbi:hypothetical protein G7Z17_g11566 [Cylindrodendrum hubeiense]|uniref:NACHT domain-containing protein n=1 Tax=Cylindrodendrum hubeiense TaxID=595255 RepID=A0A9P5LBI0_9HYPO|nr:hypothetical protein G7Z17_g11566 [Cylindrodendrum hubeiense]